MNIPTDLPKQNLINWLRASMDADQEDMGKHAVDAFPARGKYVNDLVQASERRMFYTCRRRYETAKAALEELNG